MLNCRAIALQASHYLDQKLTLRESLGYRFHLLMCRYCRRFVRHLRSTIAIAQQLDDDQQLTQEEAQHICATTLNLVAQQEKPAASASGLPAQPL